MGWSEDKREETRDGRRRKVLACAHRLDQVGQTKVFQKLIGRRVFDLFALCMFLFGNSMRYKQRNMQLDYRKLYSGSGDQFL